jgi:hypothetical protein
MIMMMMMMMMMTITTAIVIIRALKNHNDVKPLYLKGSAYSWSDIAFHTACSCCKLGGSTRGSASSSSSSSSSSCS